MNTYKRTLTPKQAFYVSQLASGKNTIQIASENYVSHHTVRNTISKAKDRVGAISTFHLVALSIQNEWILPLKKSEPLEFTSE
jgi:DNA-binding CsgD family transcriptional regulator